MGRTPDKFVLCETPTPGKQPTRIQKWKYDAVRKAILKTVPTKGEGVVFKDLPHHVGRLLKPEEKSELGSIVWYTTTVKLDLEVRGKLKRVDNAKPQRLLQT